ncbi:squalene epoxidase-domain-containing protein [Choanephora cucurbitarum]|nr:squalene epoxidase-domain-containing protein [Choanephora cucurbitarum]
MSTNQFDLIVVGAGVVGCAAARAFALDGRKVLLLERDLSEPDRIVGELMQPGGLEALRQLGMEECTEGIDGIPCFGYSLYHQKRMIELPYDSQKPTKGIAFHHGRFIQNLRKSAQKTENVTLRQRTVSRLLMEDTERVVGVVSTSAESDQEEYHYAPLTLIADGLFSKFRKEFTDRQTRVISHFVGFLIQDLELPFPHKGFVCLAHPSPILMYQIGSHETRVLVDVPGKLPHDLKGYMAKVIAPQLPPSLQSPFLKALETERLRPMPSGFLAPAVNQRLGTILLGDALNVRSPLTGGGMTVALEDVLLCRALLSPQQVPSLADADLVVQAMGAFHWKRKQYSVVINVLAMALYSIFAAQSEQMKVLQEGCFQYLMLGAHYAEGPMHLLAGLNHSPLSLIYHFFSVAFYSIYLLYTHAKMQQLPETIILSFQVFSTACVTIIPFLWGELFG